MTRITGSYYKFHWSITKIDESTNDVIAEWHLEYPPEVRGSLIYPNENSARSALQTMIKEYAKGELHGLKYTNTIERRE